MWFPLPPQSSSPGDVLPMVRSTEGCENLQHSSSSPFRCGLHFPMIAAVMGWVSRRSMYLHNLFLHFQFHAANFLGVAPRQGWFATSSLVMDASGWSWGRQENVLCPYLAMWWRASAWGTLSPFCPRWTPVHKAAVERLHTGQWAQRWPGLIVALQQARDGRSLGPAAPL